MKCFGMNACKRKTPKYYVLVVEFETGNEIQKKCTSLNIASSTILRCRRT